MTLSHPEASTRSGRVARSGIWSWRSARTSGSSTSTSATGLLLAGLNRLLPPEQWSEICTDGEVLGGTDRRARQRIRVRVQRTRLFLVHDDIVREDAGLREGPQLVDDVWLRYAALGLVREPVVVGDDLASAERQLLRSLRAAGKRVTAQRPPVDEPHV